MQRVAGGCLATPERDHEQRRERADAAPDERDRVERRLVGPVDVLEGENGRARRQLELLDEQGLDLVRGGSSRERLGERRRDRSREVAERPERPRDREVVAATEQNARAWIETREEAVAYAQAHGIPFQVFEPQDRKKIIKAYADNFAPGRRQPWTH